MEDRDLLDSCKEALAHLDNYADSKRNAMDLTEVVKAQVVLVKAIRKHGGWK